MKRENIRKMWIADRGDGTYINPILYTDYSDPDVIRVGEDYFMIASSFCNVPAVPLLHSKDLVNWKVVNYIMDRLPFERYEKPIHGCGVFAPSIRFHEGVYYVFIPMPDEGILVCKTDDPFGKWSKPAFVRKVVGWIDPCPFWDDDGKAYMVSAFARSRIGFKSMLYITPIALDGSKELDDGQFVYDGHATQPTIEGPKLYKRNGYYYIFAPAGGVATGWQTVLRSRNIYGPYEEKIVLHQGDSPINGPHQGAWVDTPGGEDWFLHFQDVGNAGRIIHLQPMRWVEDWPVIGENDMNGCGEPVLCHKKPDVGIQYPADAPEDSDFFERKVLGLQWQWNANYKESWESSNTKMAGATVSDYYLSSSGEPGRGGCGWYGVSGRVLYSFVCGEKRRKALSAATNRELDARGRGKGNPGCGENPRGTGRRRRMERISCSGSFYRECALHTYESQRCCEYFF